MQQTYILSNIDVTELAMYLFTIFFFGLILYLRREDRREGYPLEEDTTGRLGRAPQDVQTDARARLEVRSERRSRSPSAECEACCGLAGGADRSSR